MQLYHQGFHVVKLEISLSFRTGVDLGEYCWIIEVYVTIVTVFLVFLVYKSMARRHRLGRRLKGEGGGGIVPFHGCFWSSSSSELCLSGLQLCPSKTFSLVCNSFFVTAE